MNVLDKELMPKTDQGQFLVKIEMPVGTRVIETNRIALQVEETLQAHPSVASVSSIVGSTSGDSAKDIVKRPSSEILRIFPVNRSFSVGLFIYLSPLLFSYTMERYS